MDSSLVARASNIFPNVLGSTQKDFMRNCQITYLHTTWNMHCLSKALRNRELIVCFL